MSTLNMRRTPFTVSTPFGLLAKCPNENQAQVIAKLWSELGAATEVHYWNKLRGGIIGQWIKGQPTPEFAHLAATTGLHLKAARVSAHNIETSIPQIYATLDEHGAILGNLHQIKETAVTEAKAFAKLRQETIHIVAYGSTGEVLSSLTVDKP